MSQHLWQMHYKGLSKTMYFTAPSIIIIAQTMHELVMTFHAKYRSETAQIGMC